MPSITIPGGKSGYFPFTGNETVTAGNGNDTIVIGGKGSVVAGNGKDAIFINKLGYISVGSGADTLSLVAGGVINQTGTSGKDHITLGTGSETITEQGHATVKGSGAYDSFGKATIVGGELTVSHSGGYTIDTAVNGTMTVKGGATAPTEFIGGSSTAGSADFIGKSGDDTFIGGSAGSDTMKGTGGNNVFEFGPGGTHTVLNFVSTDKLYVDGLTYAQLKADGDISYTYNAKGDVTGTVIKAEGATITLKGFDLDASTKGVVIKTEIKH